MKIRLPSSACLNFMYAILPINAREGDKIVMRQIFFALKHFPEMKPGRWLVYPLPSRYNGITELA